MSTTDIQQNVRKIFREYLEKNNHRKTEERFIVLEEIYNMKKHFDVESLFLHLKKKNFK